MLLNLKYEANQKIVLICYQVYVVKLDGQININKQADILRTIQIDIFKQISRHFWCKKESFYLRRFIQVQLQKSYISQTFIDNLYDLEYSLYYLRSRKHLKPFLENLNPHLGIFFLCNVLSGRIVGSVGV